jgi:RimJ/RimL family protein N-acetyltransferase
METLETERVRIRPLATDDAPFILELVNDPSWLRHIGDKGIRTIEDAQRYIESGPISMYERLGFGLCLVETKADGVAIGICGLIKRDTLDDIDLGFAFLPAFRGKGYAFESAAAVIEHGRRTLGLSRLLAVTSQSNGASIKLLQKLGFSFERLGQLGSDAPEVNIFAMSW